MPSRAGALGVALATAATIALVAPAGAQDATSPWTQHGADAGATAQAISDAPADPGLKWVQKLGEIETADAPDGYSAGSNVAGTNLRRNQPLVAPDGTLIVRADKNGVSSTDGGDVLLGLDPDDGTVAWEYTRITPNCGAAIDSQGRVWASTRDGELVAVDHVTGEEIDDTRLELDASCGRNTSLHLGGDDEHVVVFNLGRFPQVEAIDVSGATPSSSWVFEAGEDEPFEDFLTSGARHGVITDDALIVPTITGEDDEATAELVAFSLDDGQITTRVAMPTPGTSDDDLGAVDLLHVDDTVVAAVRISPFGDGEGFVAAFDADDLSERWVEITEETSGPTHLTAGDGVVHANDGNGFVTAYDLTTGDAAWGDLDVVERGGGMAYTAATDAQGRLVTKTTVDSGSDGRAVTVVDTDGTIEWQATQAAIRQEADLTDEGLATGGSMNLGPIDADGTVYLHRGGTIVAIDDSGGLAVGCELPFDDVDEELNVHAGNICRLVEAEITAGIDEDNYGPGQSVTRQQMATFLTRALDLPTRAGDEFEDVAADNVHRENIYALLDAGITAGVSDTEFDPTGELPRDQMATFLARAAGLDGVDGSGFDDVDPDSVHRENIYAVRDADITQGVSDSRFAPDRIVRRDQMASFLMRMVDYLAEEG